MNEPVRWRDDPDAPSEIRALLAEARPSRRMTADEFRRGSRRLTAATTAVVGFWLWAKGPAFAALIGAAGGVIVATGAPLLFAERSEPAVTSVSALAPVAASPQPTTAPAIEPAPLPSATPSSPRSMLVPRASSEPARDTLAEEARLIEQARRSLGADPNRALALLEQHRAQFAQGKLGMERELLMVDALRRAGRVAEARSRARALDAQTHKGIYAARLKQLLAELE